MSGLTMNSFSGLGAIPPNWLGGVLEDIDKARRAGSLTDQEFELLKGEAQAVRHAIERGAGDPEWAYNKADKARIEANRITHQAGRRIVGSWEKQEPKRKPLLNIQAHFNKAANELSDLERATTGEEAKCPEGYIMAGGGCTWIPKDVPAALSLREGERQRELDHQKRLNELRKQQGLPSVPPGEALTPQQQYAMILAAQSQQQEMGTGTKVLIAGLGLAALFGFVLAARKLS